MKRLLIVFLLAAVLLPAFLPAPAAAQTLQVRTLALDSGTLPAIYLKDTGDHHLLVFSPNKPSPAVRAVAANPLPLFRKQLDADGKETFAAYTKVPLPRSDRGILLLGWMDGKTPKFVAIEDNFAGARSTDWLLVNAGITPVAFRVGEAGTAVPVTPGTSKAYRIGAAAGKGAAVQAAFAEGKTWTPFFSTFWPIYPDKRCLVLFVPDGEKIRVKRIVERIGSAR